MKKTLVVVAFVLAILLIFAPPVIGFFAQGQIEAYVERSNAQTQAIGKTEITSSERGWFNSQIHITTRFSEDYLAALNTAAEGAELDALLQAGLQQEMNVSHGLLLFPDSGFTAGLATVDLVLDGQDNPNLQTLLNELQIPHFLAVQFVVPLAGSGPFTATVPAFEYQHPEGLQFNFGGSKINGSANLLRGRVVGSGNIGTGKVAAADTNFSWQPWQVEFDQTYMDNSAFAAGTLAVTTPEMRAGNDTFDATFTDLSFTGATELDTPDTMGGTFAYDLDGFTVRNAPEPVNVSAANLTVGIARVHVDAVTELQTMQGQLSADDPAANTRLVDLTHTVLSESPSMSLATRFVFNDQPFSADLQIGTDPDQLPPRASFSFDNPLLLVPMLKVTLNMSVHEQLAAAMMAPQLKAQLMAGMPEGTEVDDAQLDQMVQAQVPMMIGGLTAQGYLTKEGDQLEMNASFDGQQLLLNGQPIPLAALLGATAGN